MTSERLDEAREVRPICPKSLKLVSCYVDYVVSSGGNIDDVDMREAECAGDRCEGPISERRRIVGLPLPPIFNKDTCGRDVAGHRAVAE